MRAYKCVVILFVSVFFVGCNYHLKNEILDFEKENGLNISTIRKVQIYDTITVADSISYLNDKVVFYKQKKIAVLNRQLLYQQQEYKRYVSELDSIENKTLIKLVKRSIESFEEKIEQTKKNIDIYNNHPERTELGSIQERIRFYNTLKDSVLGYKMNCIFEAREGMMGSQSYNYHYYLNSEHDLQSRIEADN